MTGKVGRKACSWKSPRLLGPSAEAAWIAGEV